METIEEEEGDSNKRDGSAAFDISKYNVQWSSLGQEPGINSEGKETFFNTMPIGNGDVAANVMADLSGSISFLLAKQVICI